MNIESLFKAFISLLICVTCSVTFAEWQPETLPHIHSDIFSSSNDGIPWSILEIVEDEQGLKSVWLEKTGNYAYVVYAEKAPFDGEREAVLFSDGYEVQPRDMVNIHVRFQAETPFVLYHSESLEVDVVGTSAAVSYSFGCTDEFLPSTCEDDFTFIESDGDLYSSGVVISTNGLIIRAGSNITLGEVRVNGGNLEVHSGEKLFFTNAENGDTWVQPDVAGTSLFSSGVLGMDNGAGVSLSNNWNNELTQYETGSSLELDGSTNFFTLCPEVNEDDIESGESEITDSTENNHHACDFLSLSATFILTEVSDSDQASQNSGKKKRGGAGDWGVLFLLVLFGRRHKK